MEENESCGGQTEHEIIFPYITQHLYRGKHSECPKHKDSFDQLQQTAKNLSTRHTSVHLPPVCPTADEGTSRHEDMMDMSG